MEAVIFYALAVFTLVSATLVVTLHRPIHNVLFMVLTMIGLAGLFVLLRAEFIAMVQLVVYAGAIMVLFLFVIMLLNLDEPIVEREDAQSRRSWFGVAIAVYLFFLLAAVMLYVYPAPYENVSYPGLTNTQIIAKELFTTYLLPFEVASILLLAAIVGAVVLAKKVTRRVGPGADGPAL